MSQIGIDENEALSLISTNKVLNNYNCSTINQLFIGISNHNPAAGAIIEFLNLKPRKSNLRFVKKEKKKVSNLPVDVGGIKDLAINLANCCCPIPGDDIIGYITRGKGVTVHRKNCPNIVHLKERTIDVKWNDNLEFATYPVDIIINANDRKNLLVDLMNLFVSNKVSVSQLNAKSFPETMLASFTATIFVSDAKTLQDIFNSILNVKGVYEVKRQIH